MKTAHEPALQTAAVAQKSMQAAQRAREIPLYTPAVRPSGDDGGDLLLPPDDDWERSARAGKERKAAKEK
ncbi:MAG: hypothetical protein ACLSDO_01680 [Anaerotruncus colihominis]